MVGVVGDFGGWEIGILSGLFGVRDRYDCERGRVLVVAAGVHWAVCVDVWRIVCF